MPRHASHTDGFTMMEVLVALLLLGSGALALVMMQLHALRVARDGALRTQATMLAVELAALRDEFYASGAPPAGDPYLFDFTARPAPGGSNSNSNSSSTTSSAKPACHDQTCAPHAFAQAAVAEWQARLAEALPGARAIVCHDASTQAGQQWACDGQDDAPVMLKLGWRGGAVAGTPAMTIFIGY